MDVLQKEMEALIRSESKFSDDHHGGNDESVAHNTVRKDSNKSKVHGKVWGSFFAE